MGSDATPLEASLAQLADAAGLLGLGDVADRVGEAARRLAGLELEVAVVGEFKRGKSTLLNALIDAEVLPAGVLPLTAVPTVLERGEPVCQVRFSDGHVEDHDLAAVARFVTEEHNPGNRLGVDRAVVRLHAPLLDSGVRLVDTPEVGSVLDHNTAATDAYLPSLDAAILVTSADPPISGGERAFLGRVAERAVPLLVVLNKADYLGDAELERTIEFTERVVREVVPAWPGPVYPLSARPGVGDPAGLRRFAGYLRRFAGYLRRFLERERAAAVADAAARSGERALGVLRLVAAAWRLRGRRGARAGAVAKARAAAAEDADALLGRLRGATSMTLGEASRRLAGQLRRHQRELASTLAAAVQRGGALLEAAEQDRTARQAALDHAAALLEQAEAALSAVGQDGSGS